MNLLFSYGTLQLPSVQRSIFGGLVPGEPDAVVGHRLEDVVIEDARVVELSGESVHPVLVPSPEGEVPGMVFTLTDEQLAAADDYEVDAYVRVEVQLRSGRSAWVYALA